ncbi:MAG: LCP family protein [Spirochaetota bacterium]|nr:MAG: LCP family protein [Spirochaetota bacterium]
MGIKVSDIRFQYNNKRSEFDWVSILLILLAIAIIIGTILFIFYFRKSKVEELFEKETTISWISVENNKRKTESILLNFYNPKTKKLAVLVVPSRTRLKVDYEDKPKYDIVQNIYSNGGAGIVKKTMEKLTDMTFDFYFIYDLNDVERFVDLIEGLEVYSPNNLNYIDAQNNIFIKIPKGKVKLDGAKTKEFLLFKHGKSGPKTMVENHRIVAEALLDRIGDVELLIENTRVSKIVTKNIDTNLNKRDLKILVDEMKAVNSSRLLFYRMYGKNTVIENESFITPIEDGSWLRVRIENVKNFINDEGPSPVGDELNIEILNGSTNPGQAQSLRNYFVEYGFNIVHYGNALRSDYDKTLVIDRIGRPSLAKRIADIINCKEVHTRIDKTLMVDVTIVIGNDFEGRFVR